MQVIEWKKSARCGECGTCAEVAVAGDRVLVRSTSQPGVPVLALPRSAWHEFLAGLRRGEFDRK